ncbi:MAG TPA: PAS domain S-box protein [Deltaproteobacteria bacterium]|nr:PAS domain S-box protein [Deltaproteobacteria bacterium]
MKDDKKSKECLERELEEAQRKISALEESILEQKKLLSALQEIQEIYRFHFSYTRDVLYFYDNQFRIRSISPNVENILGYKPEELVGRSFQDLNLLDDGDLSKAVDNALTVLSGKTIMFSTYRFIAKDGTRLFGEVSGVPLIRDGRVSGVISVARDITDRMKAREELRTSEERYRLVVENSHEAIFVVQDGMIRFANQETEKQSGYSKKELISMPISELVHPEDLKMVLENHQKRISGEEVPDVHSYRVIDAKGAVHWVETNVVLISWEGRPATLNFLLDVTDKKKMEEEKRRLENDLIQAYKMDALGRFAGGIAHDLNNILYPTIINSEWIIEEMEHGTRMHEVMKQVLRAAYRQRDLVRQILSFSRKTELKAVPVKLVHLIDETISFIRSTLPSTIEILKHIDASSDTVLGDPAQIQQIVMNLMRNAADSLDSERGTIEITLERAYLEPAKHTSEIKAGPYLKIAVKDTGCGMTPDIMDQIFEPYFTTKAAGKGYGMGLSVVHGILKSHGGSIAVESEPGKGSLFTVFLPAYDGGSVTRESDRESHTFLGESGKILLIDDEEMILSSVQRALEASGYTVTAQKDALKAFDAFSRSPDEFDLVITDLTMPGMTGIDLVKKLLAIRPDTPVILSTGFSEAIDEHELKDLGIREMIMKPLNTVELKTAVRRALEN